MKSLLDFGTLPTFPMMNKDVPTQRDRKNAVMSTRDDVANIHVEQRVNKVIRSNLPLVVKYEHRSGDTDYAFSEEQKNGSLD